MEWFDTKRLFDDADARIVVKALFSRDDFRVSGSTLFCRCPENHPETALNHCAVYKTGCKCFSCGKSYPTMDMVKKYYENRGENLSFSEICGRIADAIGGKERYLLSGKPDESKKSTFPLNNRELSLIGLYSPESKPSVPKLSTLYKQDRRTALFYMKKKAEETLKKYMELSQNDNEALKEEALKRIDEIKNIIKKVTV